MEENVIEVVTDVDFDKKQVVKTKYRVVVALRELPNQPPNQKSAQFYIRVEQVGTDASRKGS
jgi:hypothetical protein